MKTIITIAAAALSAGAAMADGHSADDVHWHITMTVNEGKADAVQPLLDRMVAATQENEPGALVYDYMGDGDQVHISERYADNAAAMTHMGNFGANFAEEFIQTFTVNSVAVYGPAGDDLKEVLAPFSPTYMQQISGFAR
ncbi:antibiotic biosynthesis monooxygenase [Tropicimonas sp. TH_r6]|uniref:putative quinol monooxygenase n=1 Tax=Tropicimonas sp. TH_r6 TaxID=3082085 RepID=UPI00295371F6|nr:antibiotic biosynthesis monooxygenase [Tropicimonas sp. TH_r6]MDV7144558.1 antibiotic biosynthesis monooxygenase [Tropicimonas sp. TH_r6]